MDEPKVQHTKREQAIRQLFPVLFRVVRRHIQVARLGNIGLMSLFQLLDLIAERRPVAVKDQYHQQ